MKDFETLERLAGNPFYKMSEEEAKLYKKLKKEVKSQSSPETKTTESKKKTSAPKDSPQKKRKSKKGNAVVKETGKLKKHDTDPIVE